jgi:hypothetical protein
MVRKLTSSTTTTTQATDVSDINWPSGAYIHRLEVNPEDGNEVFAVMSNYGITGLYHTSNGGTSWSAVEGNLAGTDNDGPSLRDAVILPTSDGTIYFVATSTGVYSTTSLNGASTQWVQEAPNQIGYAVTEAIEARASDGYVAAATHGRGIFTGQSETATSISDDKLAELPSEPELNQNYPNPFNPSTTINFALHQRSRIQLKVFDIQGREVARLIGSETRSAGQYAVPFNASTLASGNYIYQLRIDPVVGSAPQILTRKMTLVK